MNFEEFKKELFKNEKFKKEYHRFDILSEIEMLLLKIFWKINTFKNRNKF